MAPGKIRVILVLAPDEWAVKSVTISGEFATVRSVIEKRNVGVDSDYVIPTGIGTTEAGGVGLSVNGEPATMDTIVYPGQTISVSMKAVDNGHLG